MNISQLKRVTKEDLRNTKPNVLIVSIVFLAITLILSFLIANLSGYAQLNKNMLNLMNDTAFQKELQDAATNQAFVPSERFLRQLDSIFPPVKPLGIFLSIILLAMSGILSVGYQKYCLNVSRHQKSAYSDIFSGFEYLGKVILIMILEVIFIFLWSILFIIPGIIAAISYSQSFFILFDHPEYSAMKCISESKRLMRGKKLTFFSLLLSFILWFVADSFITTMVSVPILRVYLNPFLGITCAHFYNLSSGWMPNTSDQVHLESDGV